MRCDEALAGLPVMPLCVSCAISRLTLFSARWIDACSRGETEPLARACASMWSTRAVCLSRLAASRVLRLPDFRPFSMRCSWLTLRCTSCETAAVWALARPAPSRPAAIIRVLSILVWRLDMVFSFSSLGRGRQPGSWAVRPMLLPCSLNARRTRPADAGFVSCVTARKPQVSRTTAGRRGRGGHPRRRARHLWRQGCTVPRNFRVAGIFFLAGRQASL